ncbi:hypothetical protein Angca_001381 [Angiostrongylus cantonensis]|nr:hypothetical protein Angca_001381 [Angiostrongylus cantonensis]
MSKWPLIFADCTLTLLLSANQVSNYSVVFSNAIVYPTLLIFLRYKRTTSRSLNEEIRLTTQVTLSIGIETAFFIMWEFISASRTSKIVIFEISDLLYYNAVTLPYFLMNKGIHEQLKRLFCYRKRSTKVVVFQMRSYQWRTKSYPVGGVACERGLFD